MYHISHRGNLRGKTDRENKVAYIEEALEVGFEVEIDVWYLDGNFYLGHDGPQETVPESYLENPKFWCHAKNLDALHRMLVNSDIHCFWHQDDDVTLTSKGFIWTYPGKPLTDRSICVLPESTTASLRQCCGICSDFVINFFPKDIVI